MQDDLLNSINMCSFLCSGIELLHNWGIRIFHKYLFGMFHYLKKFSFMYKSKKFYFVTAEFFILEVSSPILITLYMF